MIPVRHAQRHVLFESVVWQWLAAVLAVLILLLMASAVGGAELRPNRPRLVPPVEALWSEATQASRQQAWERAETLFAELATELPAAPLAGPPRDPAAAMSRTVAVWLALVAQGCEQPELALDRWLGTGLPPQTAVWRDVARAAASLETGRLDAAGAVLAAAEENSPENPLVHYYRGLWRLEQAARQPDWPDDLRSATRLVSTAPDAAAAQRSARRSALHELAATAALERAIEHAAGLDLNQPLLPVEWTLESQYLPTVHDLLRALEAEQFEATAHLTLGRLFFERANLDLAEEHFDAARGLGAQVVFAYGDLTAAYEQVGRHADAARTGIKSLAFGQRQPGDSVRLLENVRRGLREMVVR
jgi:tetratricopeptide (TPR) repeat protein